MTDIISSPPRPTVSRRLRSGASADGIVNPIHIHLSVELPEEVRSVARINVHLTTGLDFDRLATRLQLHHTLQEFHAAEPGYFRTVEYTDERGVVWCFFGPAPGSESRMSAAHVSVGHAEGESEKPQEEELQTEEQRGYFDDW